jgi:hypothetical protein
VHLESTGLGVAASVTSVTQTGFVVDAVDTSTGLPTDTFFTWAASVGGIWLNGDVVALSGNTLFEASTGSQPVGTGIVGDYNAATGSAINANFITGLSTPLGLAVSGNTLFVAQFGPNTIAEYDATTGALINANFITGLSSSPTQIAVAGTQGPGPIARRWASGPWRLSCSY